MKNSQFNGKFANLRQVYGNGIHQVRWDGTAMPSGVYFVRMETDGQQVGVHKMVKR